MNSQDRRRAAPPGDSLALTFDLLESLGKAHLTLVPETPTTAMIEAGLEAMRKSGADTEDTDAETVRRIFTAMASASD